MSFFFRKTETLVVHFVVCLIDDEIRHQPATLHHTSVVQSRLIFSLFNTAYGVSSALNIIVLFSVIEGTVNNSPARRGYTSSV